MQPEQLLSNALDEIVNIKSNLFNSEQIVFFVFKSSVTNILIDKNNLTNFQRIFRNEKDLKQTNPQLNVPPTSSVFDAIHSLNPTDQNNQQETNDHSSKQRASSATEIASNPLLLSQPSYEQPKGNGSVNGNCNTSSKSNSLNEGVFHSSMHINRMFDDTHEHVNIIFFFFKFL
jgi:hypothetical protein